MGYSFMTIEKIKSTKQMIGKFKHNYREMDVLNADPEKKHLNEELVSLGGKNYKEAFWDRVTKLGYANPDKEKSNLNNKEATAGKKIRSNAVYGFEVITTFSREDAERIDLDKWKENNTKWLKEAFNANPEKYGDNVLSVVYHGDEPGNVHCHAFIIPIDDKGNLNARYYVQSRKKMIELQDSYGSLMKSEHNLERGVPGSKASHQDIKRYYTALNMTMAKNLPNFDEHESIMEYRERVNEIYKDVCLQNMGLEDKMSRFTLEQEQLTKNAVSQSRKELFDKYQGKAENMDCLEREYGPFHEIKDKCESFENLITGIAQEEKKDEYADFINALIENGKKTREKEKFQISREIYEK